MAYGGVEVQRVCFERTRSLLTHILAWMEFGGVLEEFGGMDGIYSKILFFHLAIRLNEALLFVRTKSGFGYFSSDLIFEYCSLLIYAIHLDEEGVFVQMKP